MSAEGVPEPRRRRPRAGAHALVLGGGVAGLLAARVLADHFGAVTVVERDRVPDGPVARAGAPQGRHVHGLLARGLQGLRRLFPGIDDELAAAGAPLVDWTADCRWYTFGGWKPVVRSGILTRTCSRDLLECLLRARVAGFEQVRFLEGHRADGLLADRSGAGGVAGAWIRERGRPRGDRLAPVEADFVVDATGRGSRAVEWLVALGYPRPRETTINAFLGYASRWYAIPPAHHPGWNVLAMVATPPVGTRGGVVQEIEGERWIVTLAGAGRDYPPIDEAGFLAFARSLPRPDVFEAITRADPLTPIVAYRRTENRLRHYDRLPCWPARFVVMGDAACSLNPVYGQGMTVAVLHALALDECLRRWPRRTGTTLARRAQRAVSRSGATAWLLASGEDFRHPTTVGGRPGLVTRLMHRYIDRLQVVATHSPGAHRAVIRVLNLLDPPLTLLEPRLAARALLASPARGG